MGLLEKTDELVSKSTSQVFEALGRVKFLLVTVPILCVLIGLAAQQVIPERNVGTSTFKLGSFATPDRPVPDALAGEDQMRSRLRASAIDLKKQEYKGSYLVNVTVSNDVVVLFGTAKGPEATNEFIAKVIQKELDFQNSRLEKLQAVQTERRTALESSREEMKSRVARLEERQKATSEVIGMLAVQQEIDNARGRIASISKELDTMALLNASDLYIDTSQFIQEPRIIASSNWYRPLLYGAIGLTVGLLLVFLIFLISVFRSFSGKRKEKEDREKKIEERLEKSLPEDQVNGEQNE